MIASQETKKGVAATPILIRFIVQDLCSA